MIQRALGCLSQLYTPVLQLKLKLLYVWTVGLCIRAPPQILQRQVQPLDHSLCVGKNFFPKNRVTLLFFAVQYIS